MSALACSWLAVDWGSVPSWVSALTPLILAGVVTRAINRSTEQIREAVRRPLTVRQRLRSRLREDGRPVRPAGLQEPHGDRGGHHQDGHPGDGT